MRRFFLCVSTIRDQPAVVSSYGIPFTIYTNPANAVMPYGYKLKASGSTHTLATASTTAITPVAIIICNSCGHQGHLANACPRKFMCDANNNPSMSWDTSDMEKMWSRNGHSIYEPSVRLPGFENCFRIQQE